ncbi:MAG: 2Fe-2S iron-sulfur cluster-binding protein [Burkholderiales bacterium]
MIKILFFSHADRSQGIVVTAKAGISLMRSAIDADLDGIAADCGGALTCATCHVMVREPWASRLPAMQSDEDDMLGFSACGRQATSRLSCQITLEEALDGMEVDLPESQY